MDVEELRLFWSAAQGRGQRQEQEDSIFCSALEQADADFAIVADGMGGYAGGAVASRLAVTAFSEYVNAQSADMSAAQLSEALNAANQAIADYSVDSNWYTDMGTTLLAVLIQAGQLSYISVGDSLLFLWRDGKIKIINTLHSYAEGLSEYLSQRKAGDPVAKLPLGHILTSSVSGQPIPRIDKSKSAMLLQPNDRIVLASDGVLTLALPELAEILSQPGDDIDYAQQIVTAVTAKQQSGQDNTSVIVLTIT